MAHPYGTTSALLVHLMLLGLFSSSSASFENDTESSPLQTTQCVLECGKLVEYPPRFHIEGEGIKTIYQLCKLKKPKATAPVTCPVDMKDLASDVLSATTPTQKVAYYANIECNPVKTRVQLINPTGVVTKNMISYLHLTNCNSTWEDIAVFGMATDLMALILVNWSEGKVRQTPPEDERSEPSPLRDPIPGLQDINIITIFERKRMLALPPHLYTHSWPVMASLRLVNISASVESLNKLKRSMPGLQTLEAVYNPLGALPNFPYGNTSRRRMPRNLVLNDNGHQEHTMNKLLNIPKHSYKRAFKLTNSNITNIAASYRFKGPLDIIDLSRCELREISNMTFSEIFQLQVLFLSENHLRELHANTFQTLSTLRVLKLDGNKLEWLEAGVFYGLDKLEVLDLQFNKLETLGTGIVSTLPSLVQLNVSNNAIGSTPPRVLYEKCHELRNVDLGHNNLSDFYPWMFLIRNLETLNLESNRLSFEAFPAVVDAMHYMEIRVQNKETLSTAGEAFKPAIVKKINLRKNQFSEIDFDTLFSLNVEGRRGKLMSILNFFDLDFEDNPIKCDCNAYPLRNYFKEYLANTSQADYTVPHIKESNRKTWKCFTPADVRGKPFLDVEKRKFACRQNVTECPEPCSCLVRACDNSVIVNCTGRKLRKMPEKLPNRTDTVLLSHNNLTTVRLTNCYKDIMELDLSFNQIKSIDYGETERFPKSLQTLKLDNNRLEYLPENFKQLYNVNMTLRANDLKCDCHSKWMPRWMVYGNITDKDQVRCSSDKPNARIYQANEDEFVCELSVLEMAFISLSLVLFLTLLTIVLLYKYRGEIKILLYFHLKWHPFDRTEDSDFVDKLYDAFISYSGRDVQLVFDVLQPQLETESKPYRLCIHDRDFSPGSLVTDNVLYSVKYSRRMIMLLTENFLKSEWCHLEFQSAHRRVLKDRTNYLVVILFDNIKVEDLDEALKLYLKTNTYIEYNSKWFWQRLFYAMPEKSLAELKEERMPKGGYSVLMPKPETIALRKATKLGLLPIPKKISTDSPELTTQIKMPEEKSRPTDQTKECNEKGDNFKRYI